jgi:hypothetical protein
MQGIKNMYTECVVDNDKMTLEYKVVKGTINKSFGI